MREKEELTVWYQTLPQKVRGREMSKIIQSNICPVCKEHYNEARKPNILKCGHFVCSECTDRLTVCPIDRKPFNKDEVIRVFNTAEERTAREIVADLTEQVNKFEKLEKEMDKLKDSQKKMTAAYKLKEQQIEDLKAEIDAMKYKLHTYEKMLSEVHTNVNILNGAAEQLNKIAGPFKSLRQEEIGTSGGFAVGDRVLIACRPDHRLAGKKGKVAYTGELAGIPGQWFGLILDDPVGKSN